MCGLKTTYEWRCIACRKRSLKLDSFLDCKDIENELEAYNYLYYIDSRKQIMQAIL
jgi:hypothetical protein